MATRLFVGNLPENTSETELRFAFSDYGEITTLDLKRKAADDNESKKFAFVSLSGSNYDIESCIKHFANQDFNGKRLYVTRARESFLERLQKEREQAQQKELEKQQLPKDSPILNHNEKCKPLKRNSDTFKAETIRNKKAEIQNTEKVYNNEKKQFPVEKPISLAYKIPDLTLHNDGISNTLISKTDKKKQDSENKRMESMKKKCLEFKQKQNIIKTGLTAVAKREKSRGQKRPKNTLRKYSSQNLRSVKNKIALAKYISRYKSSQSFAVDWPRLRRNADRATLISLLRQQDKVLNTKIIFSEDEDTPRRHSCAAEPKVSLFDKEDSDDEIDFSIKKLYEGKIGQKVLDLQSRYKSDKRFTLDERFIEEDNSNGEEAATEENETVELEQKDEKNKQLDILQDVLGITLKRKLPEEDNSKNKLIRGMLRFDPSQPDHAKFLAPVEPKKQATKMGKKKLKEKGEEIQEEARPEEIRPEVSKEQFYNVSETLKEAIAQPTAFSLRSLFGSSEPVDEESKDQNYISLEAPKKPKVKNPLEPKEKNPFVYDSSESENEDEPETNIESAPAIGETKAVWKENLFFTAADHRLKEGLAFFNNVDEDTHKERRELKSLVKKRIYNKERKNQMFKKKIGGRRKTMKKSFRKKT